MREQDIGKTANSSLYNLYPLHVLWKKVKNIRQKIIFDTVCLKKFPIIAVSLPNVYAIIYVHMCIDRWNICIVYKK